MNSEKIIRSFTTSRDMQNADINLLLGFIMKVQAKIA